MTFSLETIIIKPENDMPINNAIILLHGYGGDGKDISLLTLHWKRFLPNTIFLCPSGHEVCAINPTGFQWFDLSNNDPKYTLEQSKKAEQKPLNFLIFYLLVINLMMAFPLYMANTTLPKNSISIIYQ